MSSTRIQQIVQETQKLSPKGLIEQQPPAQCDHSIDISSFLSPDHTDHMILGSRKTMRVNQNNELTQPPVKQKTNKFLTLIARRFLIDEFKQKMLALSSNYRYKHLTKAGISLLEVNPSMSQESTLLRKSVSIVPAGIFILLWDSIKNLVYMHLLFVLTFTYAFNIQIEELFDTTPLGSIDFIIVIEFILVLDMIIRTNTGFIFQGQIVMERRKVYRRYLKKHLLEDIATTIAIQFPLIYQNDMQFLLYLLTITIFFGGKLSNIKKQFLQIRDFFSLTELQNLYIDLIILIFQVIVIGHIFACIWHGVATYHDNNSQNWIDFYKLTSSSIWTRYNYSFYWAVMTMSTVGYGGIYLKYLDIVAQNDIERLVCNFTMLLACGVFAFSINSIGSVLFNMQKANEQYHKTTAILNSYMKNNKVNYALQNRVRSFLEFQLIENKSYQGEVDTALQILSQPLQKELQEEAKIWYIDQITALKSFTLKLKKQLTQQIVEIKYCPGELIVSPNVSDDCSLYLIISGAAQARFENGENFKILKTLRAGESFGEYSFFTSFNRQCFIRSTDYTTVIKIARDSFLSCVNSKIDRETLFIIKNDLEFNLVKRIERKCYHCNKFHYIKYCPNLHLNLDKELIIKKEQFPTNSVQERKYTQRDRVKYDHTLGALQIIEQKLLKYQQSLDLPKSGHSIIKQEDSEQSIKLPICDKQLDDLAESQQYIQFKRDDARRVRLTVMKSHSGIIGSQTKIISLAKDAEQFSCVADMDRLMKYKLRPWYNYDSVFYRLKQIKPTRFLTSIYTFNYKAMQKIKRIRIMLHEQATVIR